MKRFLHTAIILLLVLMMRLGTEAQPRLSYIIPDIGAADMNIYVELICPYDPTNMSLSSKNFGADGFFYNNPGDNVKLVCVNPGDTSKIVIGPVAISWDGRMLSSQIFVKPSVNPNSEDWDQLSSNFRIPLQVIVNGVPSNVDTFYIVKPFHFGDIRGLPDRVFGQGNLGKRSRRGAIIADSIILADTIYNVSQNDCDPVTPGNQGYLPFVLLSKGKIQGSSNTVISVNGEISAGGHGGNGGPGGGGGGGRFCDVNSGGSAGDNGGDGFTGGGLGGENRVIGGGGSYKAVGEGSGTNGALRGYSLNLVPPPNQPPGYYEASGGGTGHPFGESGRNTADGYNDDPVGGFGGGSGQTQRMNGGSGGYATNGINSRNSNGGRIHGNGMIVPLAGGSGGAGGNPQKTNPFVGTECSGSGGGGGGAIRLFAPLISNVSVSANGGNGHTGDNGADGGGGSGGAVMINVKIALNGGSLSAVGGAGSTPHGGSGRIRHDEPVWNFGPTTFPPDASVYRGPTTDTSSFVKRQFTLTGSRNPAENIHVCLKPESGSWTELAGINYNGSYWSLPVVLTGNDSLYFLSVTEDVTNPLFNMTDHLYDPLMVMSQSAANILSIIKLPIIDSDTLHTLRIIGCEGNFVDDTVFVRDTGTADLILRMDSSGFKNPMSGFSLVSPLNVVTLPPADSQRVIVRFSYQPGQKGIVRDTLLIYNNDYESRYKPWQIVFEANIDSISFDDLIYKTQQHFDVLGFNYVCIGKTSVAPFNFLNLSSISVSIANSTISPANDFTAGIWGKRIVPPGDTSTLYVTFSPTSEGLEESELYISTLECPSIIDTIKLNGIGVRTSLSFSNDVIFTNVKVGTRDTQTTALINTGTADAFITSLPNLSPPFKIIGSQPLVPVLLKSGDSLIVSFEYAPTTEGNDSTGTFMYSVMQNTSCVDTAYVTIKGNSVKPLIELNKYAIDYGLLAVCQTKLDTIIITNKGSGSVNITSKAAISGANAAFFSMISEPAIFPYQLKPGESSSYIIQFNPSVGTEGTKSADFSVTTDEPSMPVITVSLTGRSEAFHTTAPLNINFGGVPVGNNRSQVITLTNNGELDVHVIRVLSDNPDVTVVPQSAAIAGNGGTADFTVTMNFTSGGIKNAVISFIFDQPCPDSLFTNATGDGLVGDIDNTSNLDFGILAPCEDSTLTAMVTNTGTAPIVITSTPIIQGADSLIYQLSDNHFYPDTLAPGDTLWVNVIFKPSGTTDGVKQAELVFPVFMNGSNTEVTTALRGTRRSGIVTVPNLVSFGYVVINSTSGKQLVIKNNGSVDVTIESTQFTGIFGITPNPLPPTTLKPGDSIIVTVTFSPDSIKYYEDTLKFKTHTSSCDDGLDVVVNGYGAPEKVVHFSLPVLVNVSPDQTNYKIPVKGRLEDINESVSGSSFSAEISFDSTLFYPTGLTSGTLVNMSTSGKDRIISIKVDNVNISRTDSLITNIVGYTLLGDTDSTGLNWVSFKWLSGEPIGQPLLEDGSMLIQICDKGQKRLLRVGNPVQLTVLPNPADEYINVTASVLETGTHSIELMNIQGETRQLVAWDVNPESNKNYVFKIDLGGLTSGMYELILKTPMRQSAVPLFIVK